MTFRSPDAGINRLLPAFARTIRAHNLLRIGFMSDVEPKPPQPNPPPSPEPMPGPSPLPPDGTPPTHPVPQPPGPVADR